MEYFKLFACIKITRGFKNTLLIDLQHEKILSIDSKLSKYCIRKVNYTELKTQKSVNNKDEQYRIELKKFIDYFIDKGWGFITERPNEFPGISTQFAYLGHISNLLIDIDTHTKPIEYNIIESINRLLIHTIQFRIYCSYDYEPIVSLIRYYSKSNINSIEIVLQNSSWLKADIIHKILDNIKLIKLIIVNDDREEVISYKNKTVVFTKSSFRNCTYCGQVQLSNFRGNMMFYNESLSYNTCLNKKISIDSSGNLKNCPSMEISYGNVHETSLDSLIGNDDFKKYWDISKDKILVCKDCEFRNVCTDCRAYIEDPEDILSKPLKCGYNPYTGEWSEWSTNPLKAKAIKYYGMEELVAERQERLKSDSDVGKEGY